MLDSCENKCPWRLIEREIADEQNSVKLRRERREVRRIGSDYEKKKRIGNGEIRCYAAPSGMTDYLRSGWRLGSTREYSEVLVPLDFVENFLERCAECEAVVNPVCVLARYERLNRSEIADEIADYNAAVGRFRSRETDCNLCCCDWIVEDNKNG